LGPQYLFGLFLTIANTHTFPYCDTGTISEGLTFANNVLYESTGLTGGSSIRTLDPETGATLSSFPLDTKYFGEGITYVNGKIYQLTYKKKTGFIFDAADLSIPPGTFSFDTTTGEGWGLTYDATNHELIVSDGSEYLHFWDADTIQPVRKVKVTRRNNRSARNLNELEWWRGRILANVWYLDIILVIHPETGEVEKEYGT
jgi:glutaminyl-peptide cyclotransferase